MRTVWRTAKVNKHRLVLGMDTWQYPSTKDVFEEAGLYTIEHSILEFDGTQSLPLLETYQSTPSARGGEALAPALEATYEPR